MTRIARLVVPGISHQVTQRVDRRETTFFREADYRLSLDLLGKAAVRARAEVWTYCLMPDHVHAIVIPKDGHGAASDLRRSASALRLTSTRAIAEPVICGRHGSDPVAITAAHFGDHGAAGRTGGLDQAIGKKAFVQPLAPRKRGPKPQQRNMEAAAALFSKVSP
jgi:REP element-mobilizing transposase RayT